MENALAELRSQVEQEYDIQLNELNRRYILYYNELLKWRDENLRLAREEYMKKLEKIEKSNLPPEKKLELRKKLDSWYKWVISHIVNTYKRKLRLLKQAYNEAKNRIEQHLSNIFERYAKLYQSKLLQNLEKLRSQYFNEINRLVLWYRTNINKIVSLNIPIQEKFHYINQIRKYYWNNLHSLLDELKRKEEIFLQNVENNKVKNSYIITLHEILENLKREGTLPIFLLERLPIKLREIIFTLYRMYLNRELTLQELLTKIESIIISERGKVKKNITI